MHAGAHCIDAHRAPRLRAARPLARSARDGSARHALLISTSYRGSPEWYLPGCDREAERMGDALRRYRGYDRTELTVLRDGEATRANVLSALRSLMRRSAGLQEAVVYFAGHGVQREGGREPDGKDECILCHDLHRIVDDELRAELGRCARACSLVVLLDCCTSGTMTDGTPLTAAAPRAPPRAAHRVVVSACPDGEFAFQDRRGRGYLTRTVTRELRRRGNVATRSLRGRSLGAPSPQESTVTLHGDAVRDTLFM